MDDGQWDQVGECFAAASLPHSLYCQAVLSLIIVHSVIELFLRRPFIADELYDPLVVASNQTTMDHPGRPYPSLFIFLYLWYSSSAQPIFDGLYPQL